MNLDSARMRWVVFIAGALMSMPWSGLNLFLQSIKLVVASALLTYAFMPSVIWLAKRMGAMDIPDARRVHKNPTPRIGGLAVFLSVNLTLFLNFDYSLALKGACLSAILVAMVSLWDDLRGVPANVKLVVQMLALVMLFAFGVHVEFAPDTWWGNLAEYAVTALWVIGIVNAFNFLDGINGLAASLGVAICLMMGLLAWKTSQIYMLFLCVAVAGAALGFLPDNARYARPARVFLGDTGSIYLGWMMACIVILGDWSEEGPIKAYSAPALIFSIMIFDMVYTTAARIYRGDVRSLHEWVAYVGRDHLHHRLMALGLSQKQTVLAIVGLATTTGLGALAMIRAGELSVWLLLGQGFVLYALLSFIMVLAAERMEKLE